ncbi:MAG: cyclic pyranopterin phosphate synthase MoaA [Nitrospirae bacterium GWD2_57_9]|nr:MAG: cyclic pyranopterin phosphate synthase MoaA [Nitrospirae bacterium GWD2_57_9]OGW48746.1 MAG: cyclic pyranopterin phosphate synthase MoaA [Nitrospirae bacterium GWC2_57_9]
MALVDQNKRSIDYLRVSITDRCNLSCLYCKPRSGMSTLPHCEILQYEEILRIISVAVPLGIAHVRITGGEPLIRRGVLGFIRSLGTVPGIEDISLTTNGVLLESKARDLREAGIRRLNVSLDSLKPERFAQITGKDNWREVWRGIERAQQAGFEPLKINMVPVKGVNDDEILSFARLTLERALHVRFIEFMPIGADDRWRRDTCVSAAQVQEVIEREFGPLIPFSTKRSAGPSANHQIPGARGVIGFISPISKHFCAACRRLRLTADGKIRPCLLSDTEIDMKAPLRAGCSDAEIERLLRLALQIKPERHHLTDADSGPGACFERTMSRIGG